MRRMDEIRLEKGQQVTLNDDHTVTTSVEALGGPESSTTCHANAFPPMADSTPGKPTTTNTTSPDSSKKYGTFFKWSS
jgi:hypothetical protein